MRDRGEDAAASAIAFVIAGVLFMAAMGTLIYVANDKVPPAREDPTYVAHDGEARSILNSFVRGEDAYEDVLDVPGLWKNSPQPGLDPSRLGLLEPDPDEPDECVPTPPPAPPPSTPPRLQYVEFRWHLNLEGRGVRIEFINPDDESPTYPAFGPEVPIHSAKSVAQAIVPVHASSMLVRVIVHVFPAGALVNPCP